MRLTAYRGPETGSRDLAEYVLESGGARFVITVAGQGRHAARASTTPGTATASSTSR